MSSGGGSVGSGVSSVSGAEVDVGVGVEFGDEAGSGDWVVGGADVLTVADGTAFGSADVVTGEG